MYYTLSTINFTKKLLSNIHGVQRDNVLYDLKIICDNVHDPKHFPCDQYNKKFTKKIRWIGINRPSMDPGTAVRSVTRHSFAMQVWSCM